jgi:hypothetical protein
MDEAVGELLSRYLDGDLGEADVRALETRLAAVPALRAELEALARVRNAVRALADSEVVPAELDATVARLRRTPPSSHAHLRPLYRWLAAAATLLLGATVTYRVVLHAPTPAPLADTREQVRADAAAVDEETQRARPQALPVATTEEKELGAAAQPRAAHASPPAAPALPAPLAPAAPPPSRPAWSEQEVAAGGAPPLPPAVDEPPRAKGKLEQDAFRQGKVRAAGATAAGPAPPVAETARREVAAKATADTALPSRSLPADRAGPSPPVRVTLTLHTAEGDVLVRFSPRGVLARDRYRVTVTVRRGAVVSLRAPAEEQPGGLEELVSALVGWPVPGLGDGEYAGEVASPPSGELDPGGGR